VAILSHTENQWTHVRTNGSHIILFRAEGGTIHNRSFKLELLEREEPHATLLAFESPEPFSTNAVGSINLGRTSFVIFHWLDLNAVKASVWKYCEYNPTTPTNAKCHTPKLITTLNIPTPGYLLPFWSLFFGSGESFRPSAGTGTAARVGEVNDQLYVLQREGTRKEFRNTNYEVSELDFTCRKTNVDTKEHLQLKISKEKVVVEK